MIGEASNESPRGRTTTRMISMVGQAAPRGDNGEVHNYILSKAAVSCEGEQTENAQWGIPPPDLSHPPSRLKVAKEPG